MAGVEVFRDFRVQAWTAVLRHCFTVMISASGSAWAQGPNDTEPMSGTRYRKAGNADVRVGQRSRTSLALGGESS